MLKLFIKLNALILTAALFSGCILLPVYDPTGSRTIRHEANLTRIQGGAAFLFEGKYGLSGTITQSPEKPDTWIVQGKWKYKGKRVLQRTTARVITNFYGTDFDRDYEEYYLAELRKRGFTPETIREGFYVTLVYWVNDPSEERVSRDSYPDGFQSFEQEIEAPADAEFFVLVLRAKKTP
jgi:hypothetical protein